MALVLLVAFVQLGCSSSDAPLAPQTDARPSSDVRRYLLSPLEGYRLSVGAEDALRIERGFDALVGRGDSAAALTIARQLLSRDDQLLPALVLQSQVEFLAGDYGSVIGRLEPRVALDHGYTAALLLLARARDLMGEDVRAFELYRELGDVSAAQSRADALADDVLATRSSELRTVLASSDLDGASGISDWLNRYAPDSVIALEATRDVAFAKGDLEAELAVRRTLSGLKGPTVAERRRLAELEVDVGDPTQGVDTLQQLVNAAPDDFELREALEAAKFSFRLNMLPPEVVSVVRSDRLTRADFATLLYWVVPGARAGAAPTAVIATDVPVDHPQRREVVRVLNLRLMSLADPALRRFAPDRSMNLIPALDILLRTPGSRGKSPACTRGYEDRSRQSQSETCSAAVRCGIVPNSDVCSLDGPLSGPASKEMVRRTLNLLGGTNP